MRLWAQSSFFCSSREWKPEGPKAAPSKEKHLSWRMVHPTGAPVGCPEEGKGLVRMYSHFDGVNLRPLSSRPNWKLARKALVALWVRRQGGRLSLRSGGRRATARGVLLLNSPSAGDFLCAEQN